MIHSSTPPDGAHEGMPRILSILWERRRAVLLCMAASLAVGLAGYARSPTRYKSETILAFDVRKLQALPTESVVSPLPQESPVLRTELDIISSRSMAERVALKLQMQKPVGGQQARQSRSAPEPEAGAIDTESQALVNELLTNVRVMNDGRSYTIYIAYYDADPVYAATVANAFGEAYIEYQIDLQISATRRVSDWLGERLVNLRTKLEDSERSATQFREQAGLVATGGTTLQDQQLSGLNIELTSLRAKLAGAKARLAIAMNAKDSHDALGLSEVLSSPTIQLLRAEQSRVIRIVDQIEKSGARLNTQLPQLNSQLASLDAQVSAEVARIIDSLRNDIAVNHQQLEGVAVDLAAVQREMSVTRAAAVQADQLDREAAANRSIYETYLARYKQTIEQDGIATAEARVISRAIPSRRPTSPDPILWGIISLLAGGAVSVAAAMIFTLTDRSIGSAAALQKRISLAVIGRIPKISPQQIKTGADMFNGTAADFHGAIADVQAHLGLWQDKAKVIAITASSDREGTTFVVANLARAMAMSGIRVMIIEANLRNPSLAREFAAAPYSHLALAMNRECSFDSLVQHDRETKIDFIIARLGVEQPNLVLGSARFAALVGEMRQRYDIVLIDAPAASHSFDLVRIAQLTDTVVLVVRQELADGVIIQEAVSKLRAAGRHISGIVLNGVKRQRRGRRKARVPLFARPDASPSRPAPSFNPTTLVATRNGR